MSYAVTRPRVHRQFFDSLDVVAHSIAWLSDDSAMKIKRFFGLLADIFFGHDVPEFVDPVEPQYVSMKVRQAEDSRLIQSRI